MDSFELLGRVARTVEAIPVAARVAVAGHQILAPCPICRGQGALRVVGEDGATEVVPCRCADRRANAMGYLLQHGWREGLDVVRPGLGTSIATSIGRARQAARETHAIVGGNIVGPDLRMLPRPPWEQFQRDLADLTWGSIAIFGPPGSGKTMTLLRLAEVLHRTTGYPIESVQMYWEDAAQIVGVTPISMATFVKRIELLGRTLRIPDDETKVTADWQPSPAHLRQLDGIKRRIVLLDEALFADFSQNSPERRALEIAQQNARHIEWLVISAAQMMGHIARRLAAGILMFKQPGGDEASFDRDETGVRLLWEKAELGFRSIEDDPVAWRGDLADPRAWCYVFARYPLKYDGMMPIRLPGAG